MFRKNWIMKIILVLMAFLPCFCIASTSLQNKNILKDFDSSSIKDINQSSDINDKLKEELIQGFERFWINFHDFFLSRHYLTSAFNFPDMTSIDISNIEVILSPFDSSASQQFSSLLSFFLSSIIAYDFDVVSRCNFSRIADNAGLIQLRGQNLAKFIINHNCSLNKKESKKIKVLFTRLVKSIIKMIDNGVPTCQDIEIPENALASDLAYQKTRRLFALVAIQVAKAFTSFEEGCSSSSSSS